MMQLRVEGPIAAAGACLDPLCLRICNLGHPRSQTPRCERTCRSGACRPYAVGVKTVSAPGGDEPEGSEPGHGADPPQGCVTPQIDDSRVVPAAHEVVRADVTTDPIDATDHARLVARDAAGAVVTFAGVIRDHDRGASVAWLEYAAHPSCGRVDRGDRRRGRRRVRRRRRRGHAPHRPARGRRLRAGRRRVVRAPRGRVRRHVRSRRAGQEAPARVEAPGTR